MKLFWSIIFYFSFFIIGCGEIHSFSSTTKYNLSSNTSKNKKGNVKFIENISVTASKDEYRYNPKGGANNNQAEIAKIFLKKNEFSTPDPLLIRANSPSELENKYISVFGVASPLELKNTQMLTAIDGWIGIRYVYGGQTKNGIDCSAFVKTIYEDVFSKELPRTAREQYSVVKKVSTTELQNGDLLFFNTTGGVSHVGIYLQNNKFVHASSSKGVTISDMLDTYYMNRFVGAGRVN